MKHWRIEYTDSYAHEINVMPQRYYIKWLANWAAYWMRRKINRTQSEPVRDTVQVIEIKP